MYLGGGWARILGALLLFPFAVSASWLLGFVNYCLKPASDGLASAGPWRLIRLRYPGATSR